MFKIVRPPEWIAWQASGPNGWAGSADDRRDGFIHLSTEAQIEGTLARHFAGAPLLYVVRVDPAGLPIRWEAARDGSLFPHVYGGLPADAAQERREVTDHGAFRPNTCGRHGSVAYTLAGEGPRVALLLMGIGSQASDWGGAFPGALAVDRRVLMVDHRGAGGSPESDGPFTLAELAADAVGVLDALEVERVDAIGFSMGGMVAQHLALAHPERVERLVLLSSAARPWLPEPRAASTLSPRAGAAIDEVVRTSMVGITAEGWAESHPADLERLVENARAAPMSRRTFQWQLDALIADDRRARLTEIAAPTLVVHGELDPLIPLAAGRELAMAIRGAELRTLPGVGHMLPWEAPGALAEHVGPFLR